MPLPPPSPARRRRAPARWPPLEPLERRIARDRSLHVVGTRCRGSHRGCCARCEASPPLTPLAHLTPLPLAIRVFEFSIHMNINASSNISSWNRLCRNARPIVDLRIDGRVRRGRRRRWHRLRFSLGLSGLLRLLRLLRTVGVGSEPQRCPTSSLPIGLPRRPRQRWPTPSHSPCEWQRLRDP